MEQVGGGEGLLGTLKSCKYNSKTLRATFNKHLLYVRPDIKWTFSTFIEQLHHLQPDKEASGRLAGTMWLEAGQAELCSSHFAHPNPRSSTHRKVHEALQRPFDCAH